MQDSDLPAKFPIPWADAAGGSFIRAIPQASQIGVQNGAASLADGFPPNTFLPIAAGGSWPFAQDFNGILKQITLWNRWHEAGGAVPYDSTFQTAIGGYPKNAIIGSATTPGLFWLSSADNNASNPDTGGAGWLRWPPTGAQAFVTSGTYTVSAGVTRIKVRVWGAGGAGGAGTGGGGGGGGSGGDYGEGIFVVTPGAAFTVTIGAAAAGSAGAGLNGGATSFGALISALGGLGGTASTSLGSPGLGGSPASAGSGGAINLLGSGGQNGYALGANAAGGMGGGCPMGGPPTFSPFAGGSIPGNFPGGGSSGGANAISAASAAGLCIVEVL